MHFKEEENYFHSYNSRKKGKLFLLLCAQYIREQNTYSGADMRNGVWRGIEKEENFVNGKILMFGIL